LERDEIAQFLEEVKLNLDKIKNRGTNLRLRQWHMTWQ